MHELALCASVVRLIEEKAATAAFKRVTIVRLEIGALANVEPAAMRFGFSAASRGTVAEGAQLDIIATPAHGWCPDCEVDVIVESRVARCPNCAAAVIGIRGGDAVTVKNLEVE